MPRLHRGGPAPAGVCTVTGALADLRVADSELIVTPVSQTPGDAAAEDALLEWAQAVGYERVWLPGRVVALDAGPDTSFGVAAVRCPTCGAQWEDDGVGFWRDVLERGVFPGRCLACGGSLPECRCRAPPRLGRTPVPPMPPRDGASAYRLSDFLVG